MRKLRAVVLAGMVCAALATGASAQVPEMGPDGWLLPEPESAGMGPDMVQETSYGGGVEQWRDEVDEACAAYGCSTDYVLSVMACESGGDPGAVGPNGELGIMQIDPRYWGTMSSIDQIWFAAQHLGNDIYWACA